MTFFRIYYEIDNFISILPFIVDIEYKTLIIVGNVSKRFKLKFWNWVFSDAKFDWKHQFF